MSDIRFTSYPLTQAPPDYVVQVVDAFRKHELAISTKKLATGLKSDAVLKTVSDDLVALGYQVELSKKADDKLPRPVFFGENGAVSLKYEIDAYHPTHRCGIEIEAGRATASNGIYRDLIQALVMVDVDHLVLAVPNAYKYKSGEKTATNHDYDITIAVAGTLFGHDRFRFPYRLTVLGY